MVSWKATIWWMAMYKIDSNHDKVMVEQEAYQYWDSKPVTLASKAHRPAYGSDGDYFSKPNAESIFETVYDIMNEANPNKYSEM